MSWPFFSSIEKSSVLVIDMTLPSILILNAIFLVESIDFAFTGIPFIYIIVPPHTCDGLCCICVGLIETVR